MYELKIKDRLGIWHSADLLEEETPTMNYQVNSLAELKDRQASYSQALKLPKTKKNVGIFERADIFEATTNLPYNNLECRLFSNGYILAGKGSIIIIDNITEYINVQILAGNADLFDTLDDLDSATIDLGNTVVGEATYPNWIRRVNCVLGYYNEQPKSGATYFFNLVKTINQMLSTLGYTMLTNLPVGVNMDYFNVSGLAPKEDSDSLAAFSSSLGFTGTFDRVLVPAGISSYVILLVIANGLGTIVEDSYSDGNFHTIYRVVFTSNINGKIKIASNLSGVVSDYYPNRTSFKFSYTAIKSSIEEVSYRPGETTINLSFNDNTEVEVTKGETIIFQASVLNFSGDAHSIKINNLSIAADITYISADEVPTGGKLYFDNNTGFDTGLDLFKTFVQTYGLTVDVDNVNKEVRAYTMQKLYDNKSIAVDWSNKLHIANDKEISFTIDGYAKANNIKFATKDNLEEVGSFVVANINLDKTKDLFSLKWESGKDVDVLSLPVAYIPLYKYNSDSDTDREIQDAKPHLVKITPPGSQVLINHITAQSLIDTYYVDLTTKMLVEAKRVEALFNLTEIDIEAFDPFIPIYISYYGAYFYVEKINNFQKGKLTKVNLIKL